ncbi:hypothetical protein K0T92_11890 [Paenibacillus oenotherae]|uniref:Uncharacterized protein n=1 Tax=Paenibacillus oenotherae TaxID=1435645 RepID=A0ABS7D7E9_9BACL|nr:hypothetical protein [Paenibacillus oenotherae]MBW7475452.1 hypothetical protein [Paenibacillus oenotherae]
MAKHYFILWMSSTLLLSAAIWGLEKLEGNKITTTEFMGLMDMGFMLLGMLSLVIFMLFPLTLLPISLIVRRFIPFSSMRLTLYPLLGAALGKWVFDSLYDDRFIQEYQLYPMTSIIVFAAVGLVYALIDYFSAQRHLGRQ